MFHWNNKIAHNNKLQCFIILVFVVTSVFSSCENIYIPGIVDLRSIGLSIIPKTSDEILPGEYSPVILKFNTEMKKQETEGILQIISNTGTVAGDRFWKGNDLYFVPSPPWTAGTRYVLNLSGTVYSVDGRELRLERYISFYAINKSAPPVLENFSPADGASVENNGLQMELHFSCPMEKLSVESALTIEGMSDKNFEWSDDGRRLRIISGKTLLPWTLYRWTLKNSAKSSEGVPLAKAVSARFVTDLDNILPQVVRVFPVLSSGGKWFPTGGDIKTDMGPGQGIAVEFNKPMGDNVLRSLHFDPSLAGKTETLSDKSIVFVPTRDPDPETAYTLTIAADTKDSGGLKLGHDYRITFVPDIPYLQIISFSVDSLSLQNGGDINFVNNSTLQVPMDAARPGILGFTLRFSQSFVSAEAKKDAAMKIALTPFFPGTLDPIALRSVSWSFDDRIRMEWERLKKGNADEQHFYQLVIPGGRGGIDNGGGMYFKEDQKFYLEAM